MKKQLLIIRKLPAVNYKNGYTLNMKSTSAKALGLFIAVMMLAGAVMPAGALAADVSLSQLVELFIALGVIPADKAAQARSVVSQQTGTSVPSASAACPFTWTRNLTKGSTGDDVMKLQKLLNSSADTQIAASGAGSPGNESTYFGSLTVAAAAKFQDKYASEVLAPIGLTKGTGYVGSLTRTKLNALCAGTTVSSTTTTGTTVVTPVGTGLMVAKAASQPANSLAPNGAARVPFTRIALTAGTDGAVTVNNLVVERTGLGSDAAFAGIILLDESGVQVGTAKTLNSAHQAVVGAAVTIPAGTTKTYTIAANMAASLSSYSGEVPALSVVAVNTSAAVSGSLPIMGASHTINSTLTIGTMTAAISSFDPGSALSKEIGTTDYTFSGVKLTAGSGEKVKLHSIAFNQKGSASATDIANIKVYVDGTAYTTTVSGDVYTAAFPGGIIIDKGFSKDIYVKGDIIGSNAASRTVSFDIDEATDIYVTGELYNYGITVTTSTSGQFQATATPFFNGDDVTISAGSATTIGKSNSVAAQNIAINVPNQPLGGFETEFKGEAISVQSITIGFTITGGDDATDLTNVSLVDENGSVVAGPVDGATGIGTNGKVVFTDTVTFPVGKHVYTIKGKLSTDFANGNTIIASTTPSAYWTTVKGETTGDTISLSSHGTFSMNTMTVKAAALAISVSPAPAAQNITAGLQDFTFANYQLDASQSGEDVRFASIPLQLTFATMTANELSGCQLFDGSSALNTGSNVVNPASTVSSSDDVTFTFDQSLVVAKGTVKTLALKCDLATTVSNSDTVSWGYDATTANPTVTGVTSSSDVTETETTSAGQTMTVASGTLVVSEDSSSPSYKISTSGSTGVIAGVAKFRASNENVTLQRIGLKLTNTASSSASNLTMVSIWDGATKVGEAIFTGTNTNATSTLTGTGLVLTKDTDKLLTVKVDLANVGSSEIGTQGALIAVDIDVNTNTQGVGVSGTTINATGSTAFDGIRVFRSAPTVAKLSVPSTVLTTGTDVDLYRFSVAASASGNGIGLRELTVNVATSSASAVSGTTTVTNLKVYGYTDSSFSTPVSGYTNGLLITALTGVASGDNAAVLSSILQVPAGTTYYFRVTGDTTLTSGTGTFSGSVTTRISGDAAYPSMSTLMGSAATVQGDANDDFVWSPNATTTSETGHIDWTNGYFVSGLAADGTDAQTISK